MVFTRPPICGDGPMEATVVATALTACGVQPTPPRRLTMKIAACAGERSVTGRYDHDTITVGAYKGRFDKLSMVVLDSDLELLDLEVRFKTGRAYHPTRHHFKEGSRSRIFDLPGSDRVIRSIELRYKNGPGGGNAKVQIWAR
jgi:hypothetical protein